MGVDRSVSSVESVLRIVVEQSERVLETYRIDPGLIREHANGERRITQGGYGDRQIYELVQNGADELRNDTGGEIAVVLTSAYLYCANQGAPITPGGVDTILRMSASRKRGGQIGRFGVGVKSVLSVSDSPEFYSTTGSFGFDKEWATARILGVVPEAEEMPVLRMARPLDRGRAAAQDPVLAELLEWATTVVRLPLHPAKVAALAEDLLKFPAEFCLFSPHVGTVTLEDRRSGKAVKRQLFQRVVGEVRDLQEERSTGSSSTTSWRVFTRIHRPGGRALESAGELHDRPEIDISWAVPDRTGREGRLGEFWAYFPTKYKTTLRGIVNAPWKTSEDRQNLYAANAFNDELIGAVADLVVDSLSALSREDDACAYLDVMPARGREEPQWASDDLVESIWRVTAVKPSVPDQTAAFRKPAEIRLHPSELNPQWLEWWRGYAGRPIDWVDHSVERQKYRRTSVERIYNAAKIPPASVREWLEALVADRSPAASAVAVRIAADIVRTKHPLADQVQKARIVLTESGALVAPVSGQVYCRVFEDDLPDSLVYVDVRVLDEFGGRAALLTLGVHDAHAAGRFAAIVEQGFHEYDAGRWTAFWELARQTGPAVALDTLRERLTELPSVLKVRTVDGRFRRLDRCLLPGAVVPADGTRDGAIAVDVEFHAGDRQMLRELGLSDVPRSSVDPASESWYPDYVEALWKRLLAKLDVAATRPTLKAVRANGIHPAGPLELLRELSEEGRAAFVRNLPRGGLVSDWSLQIGATAGNRRTVISPLVWMVRKHGLVQTTRGLRPLTKVVSPALKQYAEFLPVAELPVDVADVFRLPDVIGKVPTSMWEGLLTEIDASEDDGFPGRAYAFLFEHEVDIDLGNTRCRVGDVWSSEVPDKQIAVTAIRSEYDELVRECIPAVLVPDEATAVKMLKLWEMCTPADVIDRQLRYVEQGESHLLVEEFPPLRQLKGRVEGWSFARCSELEEVVQTPNGSRNEVRQSAIEENKILVLSPCDDLQVLMVADRHLRLGLREEGCRSVLDRRKRQQDNAKLAQVRQAATTKEKLARLVGADQLKRKLPKGLIESEKAETGQDPDELRIAQLAINAHGDSVLRHYAKDIEARFPEVATSFRGDTASRRLVSDLHLPESFAGTKASQSRDALEIVEGPVTFPGLHEYQEQLATRMFDLLTDDVPKRAMLCLPTGAGKTRVAAEAVIRFIKARGLGGRPVLWIAQTDELCEQAVESWKFVWSKVGPPQRLTISRFWGSNDAAAVRENPHLVVAGEAQLDSRLDDTRYEWLRDPVLVIVDEAHGSVTPRFTRILGLLGITFRALERPLIGLTATPFRGFNKAETHRLVDRYGANRLDLGVFESDPYTSLQELGMLANVEHRELTGATIQLTDEELIAAAQPFQHNLPSATEQRLGEDVDRNQMLVAEIARLDSDWPVLLFATSVNHAKLMAAMLNDRGIIARAIDSATPPAERRKIIDDYRDKKIQVITNYGVLAQGFDAPATRVVVVARPTYSPNVYTQMIGRGLRGPKNGGKETCLILDVKDNITNYHKAITFTGFDHLWDAQ
ncbi:sacsin N-terminal ATP-binding-like domain-containing protein [Lentzea sp. HUAS TT2]|uniref:sacsin N-terminal ATP-binding-like domain-containing protein n=1 Tax=Lentzea sp. HUAS TT2 TaxID=3447454 RepID=UPI003F726ECD